MVDMKKINNFAIKWCDKFRDQNINYTELVDHYMADDCAALGFKMDCGDAFSEKYGKAASEYEALERIIDEVTDISLLGSAIYSQWRYFNHWAYDCAEILKPQNRAWFILALTRLAFLSGENHLIFQGILETAHIVSNNICFGSMPEADKEVEQHLTIHNGGLVWFSGYNFNSDEQQYEKSRGKNFNIDKSAAENLLQSIATYFRNEYKEIYATDSGNWFVELTNTEGVKYKFTGSMHADLDYEGKGLSDIVRDTVGMDDLYVFDGNSKSDTITKITLDYYRTTKVNPNQKPDGAEYEFITWDYNEHLIIDRKTETLEHIQNVGMGCKISHKYEILGGIQSLLENFDDEDLFSYIEGNSDDVIDNSKETKDYKITIDYKKSPQRIIKGSYDKKGLPNDFVDFAETVLGFIQFYGLGDILNPSIYGKVKRRKSEYIFCIVTFSEECESYYYYLTDDDNIEIGDFVFVPVGDDNNKTIAKVMDIQYFSEENAPIPVEKTKRIICKCTYKDF